MKKERNRISEAKHIIIDGADGLGKTTLCHFLSRELDIPIIKMPDSKKFIELGIIEMVSKFFNEVMVQFEEYSFILDRGFPSSLVYSKVMGRDVDTLFIDKVEDTLTPDVFILVHSIGMDEFRNFRDDEIWDNEKLIEIDREFKKLAIERGYTLVEVKGKSPAKISKEIIDELKKKYKNEI